MKPKKPLSGPDWAEFSSAMGAQRADFQSRIEEFEVSNAEHLKEVLDAIRQSNEDTRSWVVAIKDASDKEHTAIRLASDRTDALLSLRLNVLYGIGGPILGAILTIIVWSVTHPEFILFGHK
jgi:hypothetical protein